MLLCDCSKNLVQTNPEKINATFRRQQAEFRAWSRSVNSQSQDFWSQNIPTLPAGIDHRIHDSTQTSLWNIEANCAFYFRFRRELNKNTKTSIYNVKLAWQT